MFSDQQDSGKIKHVLVFGAESKKVYKLSPVEITLKTIRHIFLPKENFHEVFNIDRNFYLFSEFTIDKYLTKDRPIVNHQRFPRKVIEYPVMRIKKMTSCQVGDTVMAVFSDSAEVTRDGDKIHAQGDDTLPPAYNSSMVFDAATAKLSWVNLKVKGSGFAMVEYMGKVWVTGGRTKVELYWDKDDYKWCKWQVIITFAKNTTN